MGSSPVIHERFSCPRYHKKKKDNEQVGTTTVCIERLWPHMVRKDDDHVRRLSTLMCMPPMLMVLWTLSGGSREAKKREHQNEGTSQASCALLPHETPLAASCNSSPILPIPPPPPPIHWIFSVLSGSLLDRACYSSNPLHRHISCNMQISPHIRWCYIQVHTHTQHRPLLMPVFLVRQNMRRTNDGHTRQKGSMLHYCTGQKGDDVYLYTSKLPDITCLIWKPRQLLPGSMANLHPRVVQ